MVVHVKDPLNRFETDFFTSALHRHAHMAVTADVLPKDRFSIRTFLPLAGSEPLTGMRSVTCDDFTVFSLVFRTLPVVTEVGKFSNGTLSLTSRFPLDKFTAVAVHAKSAGFEETPSSRIRIERAVPGWRSTLFVSVETPSLEFPQHILTLASSHELSKSVSLHSQMSQSELRSGKFFDTFSAGFKYQPCGHMHAGLGVAVNTADVVSVKNIQSSMFLGTSGGGTFACIGNFCLDKSAPHSLQIGTSVRLSKELPIAQPADPNQRPLLRIPAPVFGVNYDLVQDRLTSHVDLKFLASNSRENASTVNLNLRIGVEVLSKNFASPRFSLHLNAAEM